MSAKKDKEIFLHAACRALTWVSIFAAVGVFWTGVGVAFLAWVR